MNTYGKGSLLDSLFDSSGKPDIVEKAKILLTDVETEGKKQGYKRAAEQYEKVFRNLEREAKEIETLTGMEKESLDAKADALIIRLESLERRADALVTEISRRHNIPPDDIKKSFGSGIIADPDLTNRLYRDKKRKLMEAEQEGYKEAKELFEGKIAELKKKIAGLKGKGMRSYQKLASLVCDIFDDIAKKEMEIAELEILLNGR